MRVSMVTAVLLLGSLPVGAQTLTPFVEAGPLAGHDRTWGQAIAATGVLVGGGVRVGLHPEFRLTVDLTPATDAHLGPTSYYGGTPAAETARVTYRVRARDRSISAAFGWAVRVGGRVELVPAAGFSSLHRSDSITAITVTPGTGARSEQALGGCRRSCSSAPLFGLSAVVRVASRLSIVPDVRGIWHSPVDNGGLIARAAVTARWMF